MQRSPQYVMCSILVSCLALLELASCAKPADTTAGATGNSVSKPKVEAPMPPKKATEPKANVLLVVDDLSADEGLRYDLTLRASDSCARWVEEGSDGAQNIRRECEVCDDKAWVDAWIEKFSEIEATVSWVSESAKFDKDYTEALEAGLEYRMSIMLQHGEQKVRPASAQEYLSVRELANALWAEASSHMPKWNSCGEADKS